MSKLAKSVAVFGSMTFISRILGFVRDMAAAVVFGAGSGYDAFIIAFKIPNFMRRLFAEGAFSQAFVPVLAEYKEQKTPEALKTFIDHVAGNLSVVLLLVTFLGILGAPWIVTLFAPGFVDEFGRFELAVRLLRITFGYVFCVSLTALAAGILNTFGRFALAALTPVILNLSMIAATWFLAPKMEIPIEGLAWGVLLGGFLQLLFQIPSLVRLKLMPVLRFGWQDPGVRRILTLMVPALFGASVFQINLVVSSIFASFLPAGSVSWLYYSDRLLEFPLGVFGVALATVILPHLSQKYAAQSKEAFRVTMDWALRWVLLLGVPATAGLYVLSEEIICTLFQYGKFLPIDVQMTAMSVRYFSLGIMAFIVIKISISAYYARQEMRFPVRVACVTLVANAIASLCLMGPLAHGGLALASVLAAWINALWLLWKLYQQEIYRPLAGWRDFFMRVVLATSLMLLLLHYWSPDLNTWLRFGAGSRVGALSGLLFAAALSYAGVLWAFGFRARHVEIQHSATSL